MGDVRAVMKKVIETKPFYMPVEVEVRDFVELETALEFDPDIIMLDNMNNDEVAHAIEMVKKKKSRARIEVSGGISRDRLQSLRETGVSHVSAGALTTRAVNVDISMRIVG
jgi:nicotinate-nucleotide pyrophosphorylase (carboxylating)